MWTRRQKIPIQTMLLPIIYQANYMRPLTGKWTIRPTRRQHHSKLLCTSLQLYIAFNVVAGFPYYRYFESKDLFNVTEYAVFQVTPKPFFSYCLSQLMKLLPHFFFTKIRYNESTTTHTHIYTGCFETCGHYCRRWFPRSLWSKKFI
jgi:hypothetical protein